MPDDRRLDFLVIGVQKGGTTSLWQHLRAHPSIAMPELKEEPFFCTDASRAPDGLRKFLGAQFGEVPAGALLGKATPQYMTGFEGVEVGEIVRRIALAAPDVKLIALLRDPIDRAISQYRMSVRRRLESRDFDSAARELLEPERLLAGRERPTETNTYVAQGEYGRILGLYRDRFDAERLHVELTADLDRDPAGVLDRVLSFLGLDRGYRPSGLDLHHHRGGREKRLDPEAREQLDAFMAENVWPVAGDQVDRLKRLFRGFLETWDIKPDEEPIGVSPAIRSRLEQHFAADAEALADLGYEAPWIQSWR
jgi:hypothetical protein